MQFRILGPLEVRDGERVLALGGERRRAVLALLLLQANRVVSVEQLVDGVWGDAPPPSALASLQNHLGRLRRELGDRLVTRPPGYLLRVADGELDLERFRRLVDEARGAEPAPAADLLTEALALWRGPPLADLADEPVGRAAQHLEELRLAALEDRLEADLALGRHVALVPELEELVAREPYRERPRRQLIVALYRSGRQADALDAYTRARRAFVDGLGTEPGRELQDLQRAVLGRDPALDAPPGALPPAARAAPPEERRTVTVLAADVAPDTLPDDPEARRADLRERASAAVDVLERRGASVQSLGGGRLLGVFGVPAAHDDDAVRAVHAAVALRTSARIGLATGEVVTGDPLVSGRPVDEAAMLRDRAEVGEALAAERTWRLVRHAARGSARDGAWIVEAIDADPAALPRRLETPIVGRERELEQIIEPFRRALAESRPHLVTVYGAPGIGKTRLAIECIRRLAPVVASSTGRCRPGESDAPYRPLTGLLAGLARDELDTWIGRRLEPPLAGWLRAAVGGGGEPGAPEETAWAARRLLADLANEQPLLLLLDDMHWAAPPFLDLVESLVELARAPLLVLCLARPDLLDVRPRWGGGRLSASSVLLDALTEEESNALLDLLVTGDDVAPHARDRILGAAEGNPLFLEQLLAAAVEGEIDSVPDSIQTLLAARLDRLPDTERVVVQAAAVCGSSFTTGDVAELVAADPSASLLNLVRRELVRAGEAGAALGADWSFSHSLIRDVAYGSLTKRARAELHERLARRLADLDEGSDVAVGHHLDEAVRARRDAGERGADVDALAARAAAHLVRAGLAAYDQRQLTVAASLLGRADALLPRESLERLALVPKLAGALVSSGDVAAAHDLVADARAAASELGDRHLLARLTVRGDLALLWTEAASPVESILADVDEAVPVLTEAGDDESLGWAEMLRFQTRDRAGFVADTEGLSLALAYARRAGARHLEDFALDWICITLHRGTVPVDEAIARATEILHASTSTYVRTAATGALGLLQAMKGEFEAARAAVADVAATFDELGARQAAAAHSIAVAEVEELAGDAAAAERILRDGLAAVTAVGDEHSTRNVAWRLALALVQQGRFDEAAPFVELARKKGHQSFWVDVWWRVALARIEAHRGAAREVLQLVADVRERLGTVEESGMHADVLRESAEALRAAGLDGAPALVAESAEIAERLGYVVALRRAAEAQRALTA